MSLSGSVVRAVPSSVVLALPTRLPIKRQRDMAACTSPTMARAVANASPKRPACATASSTSVSTSKTNGESSLTGVCRPWARSIIGVGLMSEAGDSAHAPGDHLRKPWFRMWSSTLPTRIEYTSRRQSSARSAVIGIVRAHIERLAGPLDADIKAVSIHTP